MSSKNTTLSGDTATRPETVANPVAHSISRRKLLVLLFALSTGAVLLLLLFLWISSGSLAGTQDFSEGEPLYRYNRARFNHHPDRRYENNYAMPSFFGGQKQQLVKSDRPARTTWHADAGMDVPYKAFSNFTEALAGLNKGFEVVTVEERVAEGVELGDTRTLSTGFWTLLIPAHNFTDYVKDLKKLGRVLRFQTISVSVEESSINVEMELKLATTNLKRLEAIALETKTIEEKLKVNSQIKEAEREVKTFEFANQGHEKSVEYSRVTLEVQELAPGEDPEQLLNTKVLIYPAFLLAVLAGIAIARRVF